MHIYDPNIEMKYLMRDNWIIIHIDGIVEIHIANKQLHTKLR